MVDYLTLPFQDTELVGKKVGKNVVSLQFRVQLLFPVGSITSSQWTTRDMLTQ